MNRSTLEWYEQLARGLVWAAGVVLALSVVGSIIIAGSDNALPLFEDVERQGRGVAALASLAWGVTAAGILAGIGAILRLLVSDRLERLGPAPSASKDEEPRASKASERPAARNPERPAPARRAAAPRRHDADTDDDSE